MQIKDPEVQKEVVDQNVKLSAENAGSPKYWLSLDQWRQDPEFQKLAEKEFLSSPLAEDLSASSSSSEGGWARREFLKLMGASLALTSFGCVRRPAQKIVPYVRKPKEIREGIANYYSSAYSDNGEVFGLVVTTREGRPIKADGNPDHPLNEGGMSARAHSHLLELYDPDRLTTATRNIQNDERTNRDTVSISYDLADEEIAERLNQGSVGILTGSLVSPSKRQLLSEFRSAFGARHYVWEPVGAEAFRKGQEASFGQAVVPRLRLDRAQYIVAVNSDILGSYLQPTEAQKGFAKGRNPNSEMNRLVVFESLLSLTGANADFRVRIRPSDSAKVILGLLHEIVVRGRHSRFANDSAVLSVLRDYSNVAEEIGVDPNLFAEMAENLWENRGRSLVVAGEDLQAQIASNLLNAALGNDGVTVDYRRSPNVGFQGDSKALKDLVSDIEAGRIEHLIIYGVNPQYSAPENSGYREAIKKLRTAIYMGTHNDETGLTCDYVLPDHHAMENWGDIEGQRDVLAIQQPTIRPLGETRAFEDSLISLARKAGKTGAVTRYETWYDYLQAQVKPKVGGDSGWQELLQKGYVDLSRGQRNGTDGSRNFNNAALRQLRRRDTPKSDLELVLYSTVGLRDGSLANVSWLQEFPDPVTKICWDNYLTVSPRLASQRGLSQGQVVKLKVGNKTLEVPVHIQAGQADSALGLAVGYGRSAGGKVCSGVGVNAFPVAHLTETGVRYSGLSATIEPTRSRYPLASVAGHHSMEGRQIVVEATLEQYRQKPDANIKRYKTFSAWSGHEYKGHKWGMSIDLSSCTGCSACVVACQSENNIPVVGKRNVLNGRIMQWIRIDRYYVGEPENPDTVFMPMLCQHCDNAPCETVCPVLATIHSDEGTNDMIYNRCVGTRYCANNCPYKVRRFNWFNYTNIRSPLHMALNPEVTVRSRGVMEKCTFCIHKIQQARHDAEYIKGRKGDEHGKVIADGEVITACQASCPTGAIVFGDVNDPESKVSQAQGEERTYTVLEETNVQPAVKYKTKIRNTHALKGGHA